MCRLYDAASSFTYLAVEFEVTELDEVEELDPLARLFEFARRARDLANEQQVTTYFKLLIARSWKCSYTLTLSYKKIYYDAYFPGLYGVLYCYQR